MLQFLLSLILRIHGYKVRDKLCNYIIEHNEGVNTAFPLAIIIPCRCSSNRIQVYLVNIE